MYPVSFPCGSLHDIICYYYRIIIFHWGNHESETMNQMYGFHGEVKSKYNAKMSDIFTEVYNWLPLAQVINEKVLVMHGGLFSEDSVTLDDIRKVDRNRQPPDSGELWCPSGIVSHASLSSVVFKLIHSGLGESSCCYKS